MVYIHVKKVGNKRYYTLRLAVRKGDKIITKDLENLGSDINAVSFNSLEKKYKKEIRKSYKNIKKTLESEYYIQKAKQEKLPKNPFFTREQSEEIEATKLHYLQVFHKAAQATQDEAYQWFLIKFAVSSTSIEGNTISLEEATKFLQEEILPKNKSLREIYDLQNTQKVFFYLLRNLPELSLNLIEQVHNMLLENIDARKGYRATDLHILGQPFKPSHGRYVKTDLELLLKWYHQQRNMHPLALAIFFHHKFENIHPFADGNGRTGRLLLNLILLKNKYPPFLIPQTLRNSYLDVLSEADKTLTKSVLSINKEEYQKLFNFMVDQYLVTYWNTFLL